MFSMPVSSGWKLAPSSRTAATLPLVVSSPALGGVDSRDQPEHRALARAIGANDGEGLTLVHLQIKPAHRKVGSGYVQRLASQRMDDQLPERACAFDHAAAGDGEVIVIHWQESGSG